MRLLLIVLSLLFMSVAIANEGGGEAEAEAGAKYIEMTPKFTVNLAEPKKFLMINVQLLVEGGAAIAAIKKHMPALRHELIMLYSGRSAEQLQNMEQREALRQETTAAIFKTIEKMEGGTEHEESAKKEDTKDHKKEHKKEKEEESKEEEHSEGFKEAYFTEFLIN